MLIEDSGPMCLKGFPFCGVRGGPFEGFVRQGKIGMQCLTPRIYLL